MYKTINVQNMHQVFGLAFKVIGRVTAFFGLALMVTVCVTVFFCSGLGSNRV